MMGIQVTVINRLAKTVHDNCNVGLQHPAAHFHISISHLAVSPLTDQLIIKVRQSTNPLSPIIFASSPFF